MFRTGAQLFILTILVGLFLMREASREPVRKLDEAFADFLAVNSQREDTPARTTLIQIDDEELSSNPWPWSPVDFALYFQSSNPFNPEVLATDELLVWERGKVRPELADKLTQYEQILREHVLKSPRVLLGAKLGFPEDPDKLPPLESIPVIRNFAGDASLVPEFTVVDVQPSEAYRLSSSLGFTNLPTTSNWHRSVPLVLRYRGQLVPAFVLQAILLWEKSSIDEVSIELGSHVSIGDRLSIPIDETGAMRVDFGAKRDRCGLDDLVLAAEQHESGSEARTPAETFAGRFLLLSRTDRDAATLHLAHGRPGSQGELFAAAIATIQGRSFIQKAPWWSDLVIIGLFALASYWIPRWSKGLTVFLGLVSLPAYTLIALAYFSSELRWLSAVMPLGLVVFLLIYRLVSPNINRWAAPPKP